MKSITFRFMALLLAFSMFFAGCANRPAEPTETTTSEQVANSTASSTEPSSEPTLPAEEHRITVTNLAGKPLSRVDVKIYSDSTLHDLIGAGKTDSDGVFTFKRVRADGYVAVISDVPTGYAVEPLYPLSGVNTTISLGSGVMTDEDMSTVVYRLGDAVLDFSLTGPDGTVYTLSDLLQTKKAVVLNFWYLNCDPCKEEFPHIQQAYEQYSDQIAFLAVNPYDGDDQSVAAFKADNGYTFPVLKGDVRWSHMFSISAFPLTVVIDRYGNLCLTHSGSVPDANTFMNLFAYFSAEDYVQEYFRSVILLPNIHE